jgi:uncharacterized protein YkwD
MQIADCRLQIVESNLHRALCNQGEVFMKSPARLFLTLLVCVVVLSWLHADSQTATPAISSKEKGKSEVKLSAEEQMILKLTNEARAKEKMAPLKPNSLLCEAARAHSANMARQHKMEHELDGKTPAQRVDATGYTWSRVGENIAYGLNTPIETIFQGWMDSKGHRENILNDRYTEIGIGLSGSRGEVYYTQVFGKPRRGR